MKFFREKRVLDFDDNKVEIYEIDINSLLKLTNGEYQNNNELIIDNSTITEEELENISIEAFREIENTFLELNKKHFEKEGEEKVDKKKS